jgi:hypothetical protein
VSPFVIDYEPRLVEEAVLLALEGHPEEMVFREERNRLYEIADPEARDAAFRAVHGAWFQRLGLGRTIGRALWEQPSIIRAVRACVVTYAASPRQEGAELFVRPPREGMGEAERRSVVVRLRPETLLASGPLLTVLRRELLHIADMLDPRFGYEPRLPLLEVGPAHEGLLRERYRVLWDAYVDGRLARLGWAPAEVRADRLGEFKRAFPMLGARAEAAFDRFFGAAFRSHAELVAFVVDPGGLLAEPSSSAQPDGRCPLCRFPTHAFEPEPGRLPRAVREEVRRDFPGWDPAAGLCLQCADLYRSRSLSPGGVRHAG